MFVSKNAYSIFETFKRLQTGKSITKTVKRFFSSDVLRKEMKNRCVFLSVRYDMCPGSICRSVGGFRYQNVISNVHRINNCFVTRFFLQFIGPSALFSLSSISFSRQTSSISLHVYALYLYKRCRRGQTLIWECYERSFSTNLPGRPTPPTTAPRTGRGVVGPNVSWIICCFRYRSTVRKWLLLMTHGARQKCFPTTPVTSVAHAHKNAKRRGKVVSVYVCACVCVCERKLKNKRVDRTTRPRAKGQGSRLVPDHWPSL